GAGAFGWRRRPGGLPGLPGLSPGRRELVRRAEPLQAAGDEVLDPPQVFLVGGFGAQRQRARGGAQRALAPAGADDPAGVGPFGVPHLGAVDGVAPVAGGAGVAALRAHVAGMLAELDEIAARAAGREVGFGGAHGGPLRFVGAPALVRVASHARAPSGSVVMSIVLASIESTCHPPVNASRMAFCVSLWTGPHSPAC